MGGLHRLSKKGSLFLPLSSDRRAIRIGGGGREAVPAAERSERKGIRRREEREREGFAGERWKQEKEMTPWRELGSWFYREKERVREKV